MHSLLGWGAEVFGASGQTAVKSSAVSLIMLTLVHGILSFLWAFLQPEANMDLAAVQTRNDLSFQLVLPESFFILIDVVPSGLRFRDTVLTKLIFWHKPGRGTNDLPCQQLDGFVRSTSKNFKPDACRWETVAWSSHLSLQRQLSFSCTLCRSFQEFHK